MTGLSLDQIDLVELNEAFAAQVLACLRDLPIDPERLNVNGGAIALGHPLGCTGAKLTATLVYEMRTTQRPIRPCDDVRRRRDGRRGNLRADVIRQRLRPRARRAAPSESERGWGPASTEKCASAAGWAPRESSNASDHHTRCLRVNAHDNCRHDGTRRELVDRRRRSASHRHARAADRRAPSHRTDGNRVHGRRSGAGDRPTRAEGLDARPQAGSPLRRGSDCSAPTCPSRSAVSGSTRSRRSSSAKPLAPARPSPPPSARRLVWPSHRSSASAPRPSSSEYVPRLVSGETIGAYALSESASGSDALGARARATASRTAATRSRARRCGSPTAVSPTSTSSSPRSTASSSRRSSSSGPFRA